MTTSDFERRLEALERAAEDGGRLVIGVERLSDETAGLNVILNKVDDQQQCLSRLGRDLDRVSKTTVTKNELEKARQHAREEEQQYRKGVLARIYVAGILALALAGVLAVAASGYIAQQKRNLLERKTNDYQACLGGEARINAVRDYLNEVTKVSTNEVLREKASEVVAQFPPTNCEALKP